MSWISLCYNLTYQIKRRPASSVPIRASESPSTVASAPTQTPGDTRGWGLGVLRERRDTEISVQWENNWDRIKTMPTLCYLPLSDSVNTCRVEPEAEWQEVTTLDLDTPTTAWISPSRSSTCKRLEHDRILCTWTRNTQLCLISETQNSWFLHAQLIKTSGEVLWTLTSV